MPNTREKLIELLKLLARGCVKEVSCRNCEYQSVGAGCSIYAAADHLISNGVTVQRWIPLSEQKPNRDELVLVFFEGMRDTDCAIQVLFGWCIGGSATHWMPLPEAPKGE